jgi:hypothetical protein
VEQGTNDGTEDREAQDRRLRASAIGLIFIIVLAIGGYMLVQVLKKQSKLEDCLMSGRTNCAPIDSRSR